MSQRTCLYIIIPVDAPSGSLFTLTQTSVWKFTKCFPGLWPLLLLLTKLEVCSLLFSGDTDLWLFSWRAHQAPLLPPAGHPHAPFSSQRVSTTQLHLPGVKVASIKIMFQSLNETSSFWGGLGSGVERWCIILIRKLSTDGNIPPVDLNPTEWYGAGYHVQFSCSVMSNSFQPHGLQHARLPCPSPTPRACSNSCPLSWWCHPTISSSIVPFSCLNLSQHQSLFKWVSSSNWVAKVLELQLQHQSFQWIFRTDFL